MFNIIATLAGVLFGYGLALSGMVSPGKVVGFLDITGNWDPSLAFVMGGAVGVTFIAFRLLLKRPHPIFGDKFHVPTRQDIDSRLIIGAALFGIGWAVGGLCPGPAISSLAYAEPKILTFVLSMVVGIFGAKILFPASR
ncbi:DUF6691 family protein [Sneathiella chinensis]|uniref:Membrane protein n=1 Tax=Sneathiella chinensis TaxID=349750 RepID=A0ABQ5U935_9PROT|nr:DUF6691 family protein [Sneathiella chinensis]GLQ07698.1 membrane protein [Sneathiella chinensis]